MHLSIILPTYNEKNNINVLINKILEVLKDINQKEIIVVDDNSSDGTYTHCKSEFEKNDVVKLIMRKTNKGLAASIGEGIKKSKGKNIIIMDTDLSHDPKHIPQMINLIKNYDIVSCSRYCEGGSMVNKFHFYCSFSYNLFLQFILNTKIKDNTGGYFCIKKEILDLLPFEKIFYGYGEYFFRLLYFSRKIKKSIVEIPTLYNQRTYRYSKSNFFILLFKYFFSAIRLRFTSS